MTNNPSRPTFQGLSRGMASTEAIAVLRAGAALRGEAVSIEELSDPEGWGATIVATGPIWTVSVVLDAGGFVTGDISMYRNTSLGLDEGLAWMKSRLREYGPPTRHFIEPMLFARRHVSRLAWSIEGRPSISLLRDREWSVCEDWGRRYVHDDQKTESFVAQRARVENLAGRVEGARARFQGMWERDPSPLGRRSADAYIAYLDATLGWLTSRREALHHLGPLVRDIPLVDGDGGRALAFTNRLLAMAEHDAAFGLSAGEGAFLVRPLASAHHLWEQSKMWWGVGVERLSFDDVAFARRGVAMPKENVYYVDGPFAERLLREDVLPGIDETSKIYPASKGPTLDDVDEALVESEAPPKRPRRGTARYRMLRIIHRPSRVSVCLNGDGEMDRLRAYAHALLTAKLRARRR